MSSTNVVLGYLSLKAISKKLDKKKAQFDCFDRSYIRDFDNVRHQGYGKTQ